MKRKNKFEWVAWREKNHHFFWLVSLQKGIENNKSLGTGNHKITLKQSFICDLHSWRGNDNDNYDGKKCRYYDKVGRHHLGSPIIYINIDRSCLKLQTGKILNLYFKREILFGTKNNKQAIHLHFLILTFKHGEGELEFLKYNHDQIK